MNKIKEFEKSIEGVKFTPAQKKIVDLILRGWEIKVVYMDIIRILVV